MDIYIATDELESVDVDVEAIEDIYNVAIGSLTIVMSQETLDKLRYEIERNGGKG